MENEENVYVEKKEKVYKSEKYENEITRKIINGKIKIFWSIKWDYKRYCVDIWVIENGKTYKKSYLELF